MNVSRLTTSKLTLASVLVFALSFALAFDALAQSKKVPGPLAQDHGSAVDVGRMYFLQYCASCHGKTGTGDGPIAAFLTQRPPNLRRLYLRYGSPLQLSAVARFIDGRRLLPAHGTREMPVWGYRFNDVGAVGTDAENIVRRRLHYLVEFLDSIQLGPAYKISYGH